MIKEAPWQSIVDFATHPEFCGLPLYPRQRTLLKLIFLETENMTDFDHEVIGQWREGFKRPRDTYGVQPDIWERIEYLKARGYRRFPHIQAVMGRRASKGLLGAVLGAEQIAYFHALGDWQAHYGVVANKPGYLSVVATSQGQAKRHQFADIRGMVETCAYLQPHVASSKDYELAVRTSADLRYLAELRAAGITPEHEVASLRAIALSTISDVVRGAAGYANFYDEAAHFIQTGSTKSGEEIYESGQPALDQFGKDGLTYLPSSPFSKVGFFFRLYQLGSVLISTPDGETRFTGDQVDVEAEIAKLAAEPEMLIVQLPSWSLYLDWERGQELVSVKFKGPIQWSPAGDRPENERMRRLEMRNPDKFRVERRAQFAEVTGQYLDPAKVDAMFTNPSWRDPLTPSPFGRLDYSYRIHCDPSKTGANFALAIGHTELAPPDEFGERWPHVIIDRLQVWQPSDFPVNPETGKAEVDYTQIERELDQILYAFPSTTKFSSDQWNCVKRDTLISTEHGLLTIEELAGQMEPGEIRPESVVVRSRGSEQVAAQVYRKGTTATRRFTTWSGAQIECTPEHRLWVRRGRKEGWRRAATIVEGDELVLQRGGIFPESPAVLNGGPRRTSAKVLRKAEVDEEVAAFLGYMISEGYLGPDASFRFCQKDPEVVADFCDLAENILGRRPAQTVRSFISKAGVVTQNIECRVHSIPLARALGYAQQPSLDKTTPMAIRSSPRKVVVAYLSALFEGDGGVTPDGISYWSLSEQLVRETQQMLLMLGIFSRIRCYRPSRTKGTHPRWVLTTSGPEAIRFCEEIGFRSSRKRQQAREYVTKLRAGRTLGAKRARFLVGEEVREPISRIEQARAECYDLSVPATECYIANGFVSHNSAGFLQRLRHKYSPQIRVVEETATEKANYERAEKFKSALNLGWVHSYLDNFYEDGSSLLSLECKFLSEQNGKVVKQDYGPVTTKDLYDAVSVVATDLLHEALERWEAGRLGAHAYGSTFVSGLKSGREIERAGGTLYREGHRGKGRASWEALADQRLARRRRIAREPRYPAAKKGATSALERRFRAL